MRRDEDPAYLLMPLDRYERVEIGDRVIYLPLPGASAASSTG